MYTYSFEKLEAWQLAKKLVVKIYQITSKFPSEEKFGIVSQNLKQAILESSKGWMRKNDC